MIFACDILLTLLSLVRYLLSKKNTKNASLVDGFGVVLPKEQTTKCAFASVLMSLLVCRLLQSTAYIGYTILKVIG